MSNFPTLKRTSLLYSGALLLLSLPGVTGKIPGLDISGVSAGFALLALAATASYYFIEFLIAWYRSIQPELNEDRGWRTQTGLNARIAIHNLQNGLGNRARVEAELIKFVERSGHAVHEHTATGAAPAELQTLLLNVERLLAELKEGDVRTRENLSTSRRLAKGMLLFGVVNRAQLFWFDLMWPVALFVAGILHFVGHYPWLAFFPSLPEALNAVQLVPVAR